MLGIALIVCGVLSALSGLYGLYFAVTAFPLTHWRQPPGPDGGTVHRFAVLVFAKNEETVIGQLLDTLRAQDYPTSAFDIFVTADNCTDGTARVAAQHGAIVWERHDTDHIGKGFALHWFFERFRVEYAGRYDACAVFDADNVVDPGFLAAMNRQFNRGMDVVIGYRLGKNPSGSAVAGATSLFWLFQTRLFLAPRARRGVPCPTVGGTGYVFLTSVLPDLRWQTHSVCEDIEFTLQSIIAGHRVSFAYDAVFYDEQPLTWAQSMKQRYRWSVGGIQNVRLNTPGLVRELRTPGRNTFDAAVFSVGTLVSGISALVGVTMTVLTGVSTGQWMLMAVMGACSAVVAYLAVAAVARGVLALEKVWWPGASKAVAAFPIFLATWVLLYIAILFHRSTTWVTIPHVAPMTLGDAAALTVVDQQGHPVPPPDAAPPAG